MKRLGILAVLFSLFLVAVVIFTSCAAKPSPKPSPAPSPAPTTTATVKPSPSPTPTTAPTTTAPSPTASPSPAPTTEKPKFAKRTWQFANYMTGNFESWLGGGAVIGEQLAKLTDGAITIVPRHSSALLAGKDMPAGIAKGIADMGYMNPREFPAQFPTRKIGGVSDPFLSGKHSIEYWAYLNSVLYYEFSRKELTIQGLFPLIAPGSCEYNIFTTKKVTKVDDLKGMRLRQSGGVYEARFFEAMGAVGVPMPYGDYYDAVSKGIIDGGMSVTATFYTDKLLEPTPYFVTLPGKDYFTGFFGGSMTAMNLTLWNSLSDVEKRVILQAARAGEESRHKGWEPFTRPAYKELRANPKNVFTEMPMSEVEKIMKHPKVANQWDDLSKEIDTDTKSDTGTKMIKRFFELANMSDSDLRKLWEQIWDKRIAELF